MQRRDYFMMEGDRSHFDFGQCSYKKGFAQVDTSGDAPYFGLWANPNTLEIVQYCEGDVTELKAETETEFTEALQEMNKFYTDFRIDASLQPAMEKRFISLGLEVLLSKGSWTIIKTS